MLRKVVKWIVCWLWLRWYVKPVADMTATKPVILFTHCFFLIFARVSMWIRKKSDTKHYTAPFFFKTKIIFFLAELIYWQANKLQFECICAYISLMGKKITIWKLIKWTQLNWTELNDKQFIFKWKIEKEKEKKIE